MNAIGADTIQMLQAGVQEASTNFAALVVGNEAQNFSAGANLMLVLLEAQEENWDELDLMVRAFQQATWRCVTPTCRSSSRLPVWRSAADARSRCTPIASRRQPRPTSASSRSGSG